MAIQGICTEDLANWQTSLLRGSATILVDNIFDDHKTIASSEETKKCVEFDNLWCSIFLPKRFSSRYTSLFIKNISLCLITVAWKLEAHENYFLASVAEEIAMHGILSGAEILLDLDASAADQGETSEYGDIELASEWINDLKDDLFEDTDFLLLYDDAWDGIEEDETFLTSMRIANLSFGKWFIPFRSEYPVHPYILD